jgi:uncharacterized damage-inducible protein DinB
MSTLDALLPQYDREMALTRKVIERIPGDKLNWKPHPKSTSFIGLGRHLAHMVTWADHALTEDATDVANRKPMPATPAIQDVLRIFDENVARVRALLASKSEQELAQIWTLTYQGKTALTHSRAAVIQTMILNHLIHHRGQLSVYLRLNDIPVPSIYGPSADEQQ